MKTDKEEKVNNEKSRKTKSDEFSKPREIKIKIEKDREYNKYYHKIAGKYRLLKFITLAVLLIYVVVMLGMYRSQITYDNLIYLLKDLDTDVTSEGARFADIKYDESNKMSCGIFKNRLAVAAVSTFTLYNSSGSTERSYNISMENPCVLCSDKYALVYDVGGINYSIYTTLSDVLTKHTDMEIQSAALSDTGSFALVTRSRENRYTVDFYDADFREISKIYKDKYVMDVSIDNSGRYAIASWEIVNSEFVCEVMCGKVDSENAVTSTVAGAMPLDIEYFDDGSFAVVCDTLIAFYSPDGEKTSEFRYSGSSLSGAGFCKDRVYAAVSENIVGSVNTFTVLSSDGKKISEKTVDSKIGISAIGERGVFFAYDGKLTAISDDGSQKTADCSATLKALIPFADNVVVCSPVGAAMGFDSDAVSGENKNEGDKKDVPETVEADFKPIG